MRCFSRHKISIQYATDDGVALLHQIQNIDLLFNMKSMLLNRFFNNISKNQLRKYCENGLFIKEKLVLNYPSLHYSTLSKKVSTTDILK